MLFLHKDIIAPIMSEPSYSAGSIVTTINEMRKSLAEQSTLLHINREEVSEVRRNSAKIIELEEAVTEMGSSLKQALEKASSSVDRALTVLEGHKSVSLYSHLITTGVLSLMLVIMVLAFTRLEFSASDPTGGNIKIGERANERYKESNQQ